MKKIILSIIAAASLAFVTLSCEQKKEDHTGHEIMEGEYTCPMHPEVKSNKPGACPKCGMDLVKKEHHNMPMDSSMGKKDSMMKM